jgi:hypothetical protein
VLPNTFQTKKTVNYFNIKQFNAKKSNPKATTKYKPIPPFNNSPFGLYTNGFNKLDYILKGCFYKPFDLHKIKELIVKIKS